MGRLAQRGCGGAERGRDHMQFLSDGSESVKLLIARVTLVNGAAGT